jgi:hypothetical protein
MACCPALFDHKVLYQTAKARKRWSVAVDIDSRGRKHESAKQPHALKISYTISTY